MYMNEYIFIRIFSFPPCNARYGKDIAEQLKAGTISVGLYHTAGKGTRLAPLPGAENNNKPGVKLPITVKIGKSKYVSGNVYILLAFFFKR